MLLAILSRHVSCSLLEQGLRLALLHLLNVSLRLDRLVATVRRLIVALSNVELLRGCSLGVAVRDRQGSVWHRLRLVRVL